MTSSGLMKKTQRFLFCFRFCPSWFAEFFTGGSTVISLLSDTDINLHEVTANVCANSSKWKHTPLWNSWILVMPFSWKLTSKTTFFYCFAVSTSIYCWTDLYDTNTCLSKCSYQCLTWANLPLRTCFSERETERMYCTDVVCWLVIDGSPTDQRVLLWQTWVEVNCRFLVMYNQRHKVQTNRCKETAVCWGLDGGGALNIKSALILWEKLQHWACLPLVSCWSINSASILTVEMCLFKLASRLRWHHQSWERHISSYSLNKTPSDSNEHLHKRYWKKANLNCSD